MFGKSLFSLAVAGLLIGSGTVASAETTEWFSGKDQRTVEKRLKGKLLMRIECRDTNRVGLNVADFEYRVTYTDNPNRIRFRWAVGNHYGPLKAKSERDGYKQVSYDSFRRKKSGLKIHCAVWHKKR